MPSCVCWDFTIGLLALFFSIPMSKKCSILLGVVTNLSSFEGQILVLWRTYIGIHSSNMPTPLCGTR